MADLNGPATASTSTAKPTGDTSFRDHLDALDRTDRLELLALTGSGLLSLLLAPVALKLLAFEAVRDNRDLGYYVSNYGYAFQQWGAVVILVVTGWACLVYAALKLTDRTTVDGPSRTVLASSAAFAALGALPLPVVPLLFVTVALWFRPSGLVRSVARVVSALGAPVILFWVTLI